MSNNVTKTKIMEAAEELLLTNNFEDITKRKIRRRPNRSLFLGDSIWSQDLFDSFKPV